MKLKAYRMPSDFCRNILKHRYWQAALTCSSRYVRAEGQDENLSASTCSMSSEAYLSMRRRTSA